MNRIETKQEYGYKIKHKMDAFDGRKGRYDFLQATFPNLFKDAESILDVGCDDNYLKKIYGDKIFGVDIGGNPDRSVDLEKESLGFIKDNKYELSICTEVLEHVDNFHEVLDDIVRVTSKKIIISLPNCASTRRLKNLLKTSRNGKFYGLPLEKPIDRHKWFFSYVEIIEFFEKYSQKNNLDIEEIVLHYSVRFPQEARILHKIKQQIMLRIVQLFKLYSMSQDVFIVLKKK